MKNKAKKWIASFFIFSLLSVGCIGLVNYIVDPFEVFNTGVLKYPFQINERFVKIEFLEKNNRQFNGYLFGSSRIGTTSPSIVEKYIPNSKFYNLTVSSANLYDYMVHLKFFIERDYPIDALYLQLDVAHMSRFGGVTTDYLKRPHPSVLGESLNGFYIEYLSGFFPSTLKGKIIANIKQRKRSYFMESGIWTLPDKEKELSENCDEYVKKTPGFGLSNRRTARYTTSVNSMNALSEIKRICEENNIKLYVFITPHHKVLMDSYIVSDYLRFLKDVSNITDYYDFSGYNTITTNNCNYYEESHYRPAIGKMIAGRIFNDLSMNIPKDFGHLVTKDNVDQYLVARRNEMNDYDLIKENFAHDALSTQIRSLDVEK